MTAHNGLHPHSVRQRLEDTNASLTIETQVQQQVIEDLKQQLKAEKVRRLRAESRVGVMRVDIRKLTTTGSDLASTNARQGKINARQSEMIEQYQQTIAAMLDALALTGHEREVGESAPEYTARIAEDFCAAERSLRNEGIARNDGERLDEMVRNYITRRRVQTYRERHQHDDAHMGRGD